MIDAQPPQSSHWPMRACALRAGALWLLVGALAACAPATAPPATQVRPALPAAQQMLAQVRAAGAHAPDSLEVQPLPDPAVADLRQSAAQLEAHADYAGAAKVIAHALTIRPDSPELLQQAAELALVQHDWAHAGQWAQQSFERGPQVGSLCRRNWATLHFVAMAHADAVATQAAVTAQAACTQRPPPRY
ncbi:MAG: hypothetical protein JSS44_00785 [Proteobacteria bacterium]|nr:hypothetical protein [Pseudomonadota bacterium]